MSSTYIFVDGGYLQRAHAESVAPWFGSETEIDLSSALARLAQLSTLDDIWGPMAYSPNGGTRIFYYDCLDEDRRGNETDREFSLRLDQQNNRLQELRDINDCHIRLGTLKGRKRREQKEVDVLIAVEMMAHAARGNMQKAVLVTGELGNNCVEHGSPAPGLLRIGCKPGALFLQFENYCAQPPEWRSRKPLAVENFRAGGYGLRLAQAVASGLSRRWADGHVVVRAEFRTEGCPTG